MKTDNSDALASQLDSLQTQSLVMKEKIKHQHEKIVQLQHTLVEAQSRLNDRETRIEHISTMVYEQKTQIELQKEKLRASEEKAKEQKIQNDINGLKNRQFLYNLFMPFLLLVTILLTLGTIALVILAWLLLNKVPISGFPPGFFVDTYPTIIVSALFSLLGFVSIVLLYHSDRNKQKLLLSNPPNIIHDPSRFYYIFKRFIDIVLATFGIIMLAPVFAIIALCIKLDDGDKIIYFREVIGYEGRNFYALKFR